MKRLLKNVYRALFAHRRFVRLNTLLLECSLHGLGVLNFEDDYRSGEYHFVHHTLRRWLRDKPCPVFVDVGANVGDYSRMLAQAFPTSQLLSIEPHPRNYERLRQSLPSHARALNLAVGSQSTALTLFDRADRDGSCHASLYESVITTLHQQPALTCTVDVQRLDEIIERENLESIDLLKIDTEGHELEVLRGASELIRQRRVSFIQIEFNEMNVFSRTFFHDFRELLAGFRFFRLLPRSMIEVPRTPLKSELFAFQNIICIGGELAASLRPERG